MLDFTVQFLATVLLLSGLWIMGNKRLLGSLLAFIAEFFTVFVGIMHDAWSITLIGAVLFLVQLRNFIKWRRAGVPW